VTCVTARSVAGLRLWRRGCMPGDDAVMRTPKPTRILPLLLLAAAVAGPARAEFKAGVDVPDDPLLGKAPPSPITDHFAMLVAAPFDTVSTTGRVDDPATGTIGTPFTAEDSFHLTPRSRQVRAEFFFRVRTRNKVHFDMWELNRSGVANPPKAIQYGGNTYLTTDVVHSQFNWRQMDLTWTYSFLRRPRFELGAGLGMHLLQTDGEARVPARQLRAAFSGSGPFPTVVLEGTWLITPRFSFNASAQYFKLTLESVHAQMHDYGGDLQFRWFPNVALGLGYRTRFASLDVTNHNPNGQMELKVAGPVAFVRASF